MHWQCNSLIRKNCVDLLAINKKPQQKQLPNLFKTVCRLFGFWARQTRNSHHESAIVIVLNRINHRLESVDPCPSTNHWNFENFSLLVCRTLKVLGPDQTGLGWTWRFRLGVLAALQTLSIGSHNRCMSVRLQHKAWKPSIEVTTRSMTIAMFAKIQPGLLISSLAHLLHRRILAGQTCKTKMIKKECWQKAVLLERQERHTQLNSCPGKEFVARHLFGTPRCSLGCDVTSVWWSQNFALDKFRDNSFLCACVQEGEFVREYFMLSWVIMYLSWGSMTTLFTSIDLMDWPSGSQFLLKWIKKKSLIAIHRQKSAVGKEVFILIRLCKLAGQTTHAIILSSLLRHLSTKHLGIPTCVRDLVCVKQSRIFKFNSWFVDT